MRSLLPTVLATFAVATGCTTDPTPGAPADAAPQDAAAIADARSSGTDTARDAAPTINDLHGALLQVDCRSEEYELQFCNPVDKGQREILLRAPGEAGKTYAVVLGVWGVMETILYTGGKAGGDYFYAGGHRMTEMNAEYGLRVGATTYYLNHMEIGAGDHYTYGMQYVTPTIEIPGGATVTLFVNDPDDYMNTNHMMSAVENPPAGLRPKVEAIERQMLQGQYVYLEVKSATVVR